MRPAAREDDERVLAEGHFLSPATVRKNWYIARADPQQPPREQEPGIRLEPPIEPVADPEAQEHGDRQRRADADVRRDVAQGRAPGPRPLGALARARVSAVRAHDGP